MAVDVFSSLQVGSDAARLAGVALAEDGHRDITSLVTVDQAQQATAVIEVRTGAVLAGIRYADAVVTSCGLSPIKWSAAEGTRLPAGSFAGTVQGQLRQILRAERPLLNLLQRAAGIATMTADYVAAVAGTSCQVLHTRKTTPGLRMFEISAVLAGGGALHRLDLASAVMVKDNHWRALDTAGKPLAAALAEARGMGTTNLQVEVESIGQLEIACAAGATRLLIDNQSPETAAAWVSRAKALAPEIQIEATGGITIRNVRDYANVGVDFVSTGALTHSVLAADLGLEIQ